MSSSLDLKLKAYSVYWTQFKLYKKRLCVVDVLTKIRKFSLLRYSDTHRGRYFYEDFEIRKCNDMKV